ncbi:TPA: hypothetical protein HMQ19_24870, partial [Escherichia coli]|nr:hypothetical protein [Escherichia coli]
MIQVGQYYFGDSGVKWVSFQLVLTPAYPRCYLRAPISTFKQGISLMSLYRRLVLLSCLSWPLAGFSATA